MPLHLDRTSRRSFVRTSIGVGISLITMGCLNQSRFLGWGAGSTADGDRHHGHDAEPEHWALLSDTHVAGDVRTTGLGVNMADHLRRATDEVLAMPARPAGVIVNGDCAR